MRNNFRDLRNLLEATVEGYTAPGTSKYNANVFTTYSFTQCRLKNWRAGGGVQFRPRAAITTARQVYGGNPANGLTQFYSLALLENIFTGGMKLLALMASYQTTFLKLQWNFQLNVSNVLNADQLLFPGYQSDTHGAPLERFK